MEALLRNNLVKIYTMSYHNGSYGYSSNKIHDTYPSEQSSNKGDSGVIGPTGAVGSVGYYGDDVPADIYEVRKPIKRIYRAYRVEFKPTHNTQESYDEIVCPFLDLDDIGVELEVYQPKVTKVRLGIKPDFLDKYNRLIESNEKTTIINKFVHSIFSRIQAANCEEYENIKTTALLHLEDNLISHKEELTSIISRIIQDFRQYNDRQEDDDGYSSDYDDSPYVYSYTKNPLVIPFTWYDYRHDVDFNDTTKLSIKCHEGTKIYNLVDAFVSSLR